MRDGQHRGRTVLPRLRSPTASSPNQAIGSGAPPSPLLAPPAADGGVIPGQEPVGVTAGGTSAGAASAGPTGRARWPLMLSIVLTVVIVASGIGLAVALTRGGTSTSSTASSTTAAAASGGAGSAALAGSTPATSSPGTSLSPGSAPAAVPKVVATGQVVEGRAITLSFTVVAPDGHPATQCTGKVTGQEYPIACDLPFVAHDLDYGTGYTFEVIARNDAGASEPLRTSATTPNARFTVIRQCYPPPCEPVALHSAPRRQIPESGMSVLDGDVVEVECWLTGSAENTRFDDPDRGTRYTRIFYKLTNGRYIWAPFVVDEFENPAPGVRQC